MYRDARCPAKEVRHGWGQLPAGRVRRARARPGSSVWRRAAPRTGHTGAVRLYLPATLDELDDLIRGDAPLAAPRRAHAVTPALTALLPDEDEEGVEFAAQLMAADDALVLLAARPDAPGLRLVVTVEVADSAVRDGAPDDADGGVDDEAASLVTLAEPVVLDDVVCVHVDEPAAKDEVARALDGDDAALDSLAERDLLWYDATELTGIPR